MDREAIQREVEVLRRAVAEVREDIERESKTTEENAARLELLAKDVTGSSEEIEDLAAEAERADEQISTHEAAITAMEARMVGFVRSTTAGAMTLAAGLLLEVLGAVLLAAMQLAARQEEVLALRFERPAIDLATRDVNQEPALSFLGALGAFLLTAGFLLQFGGTSIVLGIPAWASAGVFLLASVLSFAVLYYVLGLSPEQSRGEKLRILGSNAYRHLALPLLNPRPASRARRCDICTRSVPIDQVFVEWIQEENSDRHPYLHVPHTFRAGHRACLERCALFRDGRIPGRAGVIDSRSATAGEFLSHVVPEMRPWFDAHRAYWAEQRGGTEYRSGAEFEVDRMERRLRRFLRPA